LRDEFGGWNSNACGIAHIEGVVKDNWRQGRTPGGVQDHPPALRKVARQNTGFVFLGLLFSERVLGEAWTLIV
jgi:hypothetical protein